MVLERISPIVGCGMTRLLLVEDDETIRTTVALALRRYGYEVDVAEDGLAALELLRDDGFDLLVLDVMLPMLDGIGLCRRVRETDQVPILMMSARGDSLDVVAGLEAGADDYVVKPVDMSVLVARIRALLRRASAGAGAAKALTFGDVRVDVDAMEVTRAGRPVALTPTELRLLLEFAANPGVVLARSTLLRGRASCATWSRTCWRSPGWTRASNTPSRPPSPSARSSSSPYGAPDWRPR
jgi:DNA-binding response OmpR family regulator